MSDELKILPLGGLGEIGKNMLVLEYGEDAIIIDAGVQFADLDMPGIDLIIPDIRKVKSHSRKIRGLLITHGHEDHIGAVPYLLKELNVPVYAPSMAMELIRSRLREHRILDKANLQVITAGETWKFGNFSAEWFSVCHSIPDAMGISIDTPLGRVVHTGDFKIDHHPAIGEPTDFYRLAQIFSEGVFLLLSDSTYAEAKNYSGSDREVTQSLFNLIKGAEGRVFISTFASQTARVQMVADAAHALGKKIALLGRTMESNARIASSLGHLSIPEDTIVSLSDALKLPREYTVFMITGSQGESSSALLRLSQETHPKVKIKAGDTVIMSSSPIPGNEAAIQMMINGLIQRGAQVILNGDALTHVRGHAHSEELRLILNLAKPEYFVPVHGEYKMLDAHARLAIEHGVPTENVFLMTDGELLELNEDGGRVQEVFDGEGIPVSRGVPLWDEGDAISKRRDIAAYGVVFVVLPLKKGKKGLSSHPQITLEGMPTDQELIKNLQDTIRLSFQETEAEGLNWEGAERRMLSRLRKALHKKYGHPLIIHTAVET